MEINGFLLAPRALSCLAEADPIEGSESTERGPVVESTLDSLVVRPSVCVHLRLSIPFGR